MAGESKFQKIVKNALKLKYKKDIWFFKHHATAYSERGIPDVIGCLLPGLFFAVELKDKGKKATRLQEEKIKGIIRAGGMALVSDNLKEILDYLEEECEKRFR